MKYTLIILSVLLIAFTSCHKQIDNVSVDLEEQITDSLKNIATEFLMSWEPPFHEDKSLESFSQTEDFCLVIDGFYIDNYNRWAAVTPESMEHERLHYKSYTHKVHNIRTNVLSSNSGVVTIIYTWDYVTDEDEYFKEEGAITFVCRLEENQWKIIHYHGSHGDKLRVSSN